MQITDMAATNDVPTGHMNKRFEEALDFIK
jgi:hypothetical protein